MSSVSCIYGLNPPETFLEYHVRVHVGQEIETSDLLRELITLQYKRTTVDLSRGECRLRGEVLDVWMPSRDDPLRIQFDFDGVTKVQVCDPVTWEVLDTLDEAWIHPKEFFMTSPERPRSRVGFHRRRSYDVQGCPACHVKGENWRRLRISTTHPMTIWKCWS